MNRRNQRNQLTSWLLALLAAVLWPHSEALAEPPTFTVTTTADGPYPYPPGSLREAVDKANIYEGDGVPVINFATTGTITLTPQQVITVFITRGMTIHGPGARKLTISGDGGHIERLIDPIFQGNTSNEHFRRWSVNIENLTLSHAGGAIFFRDMSLNLSNCEVSDNRSSDSGAGLGFNGDGALRLGGCTFTDNQAGGSGGAVCISALAPCAAVNCTFYGNVAGSGGAIQLFNGSSLSLSSCSVIANSATQSALSDPRFGIIIQGGGINLADNNYYEGGPSLLILQNTIVAGNTSVAKPDLATRPFRLFPSAVASQGFNFIGQADGVDLQSPWLASDLVGSAASPKVPLLGPLQYNDNVGQTRTCRPLTGSPVIDQGFSDLATDQRGRRRPSNDGSIPNASGGNGSDIGAVEVQAAPQLPTVYQSGPVVVNLPLQPNYEPPHIVPPGGPADAYQWRFNGTNITGATSEIYYFTNVNLADAGDYSVILSNSVGTVTAAVATVNVGYSLTLNTATNDSATIFLSPAQGIYAPNSAVTLQVIPKFGWVFDYWGGDYSSPYNPWTFFIGTNISLTAYLHYTNPPPNSQTVSCSPGSALSFDGVNDFVRVPGFLSNAPTTEVTVEFWQRVSETNVQSTFSASSFVNGSVFNAHVPYSDGRVYWDFGDINTTGRLSYIPPVSIVGSWQHFALVASQIGNCMKIYRNGVLETNKTGMTPFVSANMDLDIGGAANLGISFGGTIDEFRIWNYARTQGQIQANMNRSVAAPQPGLVAYWRLDEGGGLAAADSSGAGHAGILTNGPAWVASTIAFVPCVTTSNGLALSDTTAALNGSVIPNGSITTNWFEYGANSNYSGITSPLTNSVSGSVSNLATRLPPGTLCHFRLAAMNSAGINFGEDSTFITPALLRVALTNSNVLIAWPASTITFSLQSKSSLSGPTWVDVTNGVSVVSNENQVIISPLGTNAFYRLKYP